MAITKMPAISAELLDELLAGHNPATGLHLTVFWS